MKTIIKTKVIATPNSTEVINYNWGNLKGVTPNNQSGVRSGASEEVKKENRTKTLRRSKTLLKRLLNANMNQYKEMDKFMTLTFRENVEDVGKADSELIKFFKRLKRFCGVDYQYVAVRELQHESRNCIHYHIVFFGLPYIQHKDLLRIWNKNNEYMDTDKMSGLNIQGLHEKGRGEEFTGFETISSYMSKYFVKQLEEDDFLQGHKTLLKSRGLKKPVETEYNELITPESCSFGISFLENHITYYMI